MFLGPLTSVRIDGLLGRPPIEVELEASGATVLTGANGTGKSTVLRALDAVARGDWRRFSALPLTELLLRFALGDVVRVRRDSEGVLVVVGEYPPWRFTPSIEEAGYIVTSSDFAQVSWDFDEMDSRDIVMVDPGVRRRYQKLIREAPTPEPEWLTRFVNAFTVLYVTDQRLVVQDRVVGKGHRTKDAEPVRTAVVAYADDLKERIRSALSEYGERSQALDKAFPNRVLAAMRRARQPSLRSAVQALSELEARRSALERAGLISQDDPGPNLGSELREQEVAVIRTYAENALQKYEVLEPLRAQVHAFTRFLNRRYDRKTLRIDRDTGYRIDAAGKANLGPADLSSGEQQLLVLAYQIIFLASENTLVLIDEPELSLHVSWQSSLVDDLVTMGEASHLSFILATHSPTLIGGRRRLRRSLDLAQ